MRVISGSARGTILKSPQDDKVRPTLDRVKESLFNIIGFSIIESDVLDLFAGSGALGIESLSRGASKAVFVDMSKESIALTTENLEKTRLKEKAMILNKDSISALEYLAGKNEKFDLIFMDPPYKTDLVKKALEFLSSSNILKEDALIIVEQDMDESLDDAYGNLTKTREKKYSKTKLSFFERLD